MGCSPVSSRLIMICLLSASLPAEDQVLVLHSYHQGLRWTDSIQRGLEERFQRTDVEVHVEYLDTKRHTDQTHEDQLLALLRQRHAGTSYQAVVATDDNALNLLLAHRQELTGDTPIVFCGINHYDPERFAAIPAISGVIESYDVKGTIDLIDRLQPTCRELIIINDETTTGKANRKRLAPLLATLPMPYRILPLMRMADLETHLRQLDSEQAVLLMSFNHDADGQIFSYRAAARRITTASTAPVYGFWAFYLDAGIVGGVLTDGVDQGRVAGEQVLRLLAGDESERIGIVTESPTRTVFDHRQLLRHHLDLARLPAEASLINQPKRSWWRDHIALLLGLGAAIIAEGLIIAWLSIEIRRRHRSELAMRASEARFRAFTDQDTMAVILLQDDRITYANPAFTTIFGFTVDEALSWPAGIAYQKLVNPSDRDKVIAQAQLKQQGQLEGQIPHYSWQAMKADGSSFWVESHSMTIDVDGTTADLLHIADINQQRQLEEQLRHSQKMDAVGQLAGGVAHDFNNLLSGILGSADLLVTTNDDKKRQRYTAAIVNAAERAADLTAKLLAFSRRGKMQSTLVDVHHEIDNCLALFERTIDPRITLVRQLEADPCLVSGDPSQIQNAVLNLAINARDAMPKGGRITIATDLVTLDADACQQSRLPIEPGTYLRITVADNGHGMSEEIRSHIFEPFFTTKGPNQGTGLGLAAVWGMVQDHHGSIDVVSAPDAGCRFTLHLPLAEGRGPRREYTAKYQPQHYQATVLVVDDEDLVRTTACGLLEQLGCTVIGASNGVEAVEIMRQRAAEIDLVILDMVMPQMNGEETFAAMRVIDPEAKIVLSSGFTADGKVDAMLADGLLDAIPKPYRRTDLMRLLSKYASRGIVPPT